MYVLKNKEITKIIVFLSGMLIMIQYFISDPTLQGSSATIQDWVVVILSFAFARGMITMGMREVQTAADNKKGLFERGTSIYKLILLFVVIGIGMVYGNTSWAYNWFTNYLLTPLTQIVPGLIIFYNASAIYRSFRVRSLEVTVLIIAAIIIMLKNVPAGQMISPAIIPLGNWVTNFLQSPANRAFTITTSAGAVIIGLRNVFGKGVKRIEE